MQPARMPLRGGVTTATSGDTRVVAAPEAVRFIQERGGRLFIWGRRHGRCGGRVTLLEASTEAPRTGRFVPVPAEGFAAFLDDASLPGRPEELQVALRGLLRTRIDVYWDGCAYVL